ncbi:MAG: repressor LexA [Bacteroidetes bacterium]|nr:repressor LexA [Bacteroidota bacterium]
MKIMYNKDLTEKEAEVFRLIRRIVIQEGRPPSIREIMKHMGYLSPRAASYILERLESKGFLNRPGRGQIQLCNENPGSESHAETLSVPLVGTVTCGTPVFASENIECSIPVSTTITRPPYQYFFLRASGDSMNLRGIEDRNLVLIRKQSSAENGEMVVALIDEEATIKELHRADNAIILKPRSSNKNHQPIILNKEFIVLGVVQAVFDYDD